MTNTESKNIKEYYSNRMELRNKYTPSSLSELKEDIESKVRKTCDYKTIKAITLDKEYTIKFMFSDEDNISEYSGNIKNIVKDCIQDKFGVTIPYIDSFKLGNDLRVVI